MIWEQELYNSLEYRPLTEFFHSFEAEVSDSCQSCVLRLTDFTFRTEWSG